MALKSKYSDSEIGAEAERVFDELSSIYNPRDMASILTLVEIKLYQESFEPTEMQRVITAINTRTKLIKDLISEGWV